MNNTKILQSYLKTEYINSKEFDIALKISNTSHHSIDEILLACGFVTSNQVAHIKSKRLDAQYIDLEKFIPQEEALKLIPRSKAIEYSILPLMIKEAKLFVAIDDKDDYRHKAYLERVSKLDVRFFIASKERIIHELMSNTYYTQDDETLEKINIIKSSAKGNENIITLVDLLIEDAIEDSASDIHISPEANVLNVFYRVNGILSHYHSLPTSFHSMIVSRIKIMSKLDISQTSLPQDGQMGYDYMHSSFRLRVSTINTSQGENIVMRLLKNDISGLGLDALGLSSSHQEIITKLSNQPNGLILVTGPTGSGKTTTLYSALKKVDSLSKNVLTVEDPVEYHIPFIKQTQINTKAGYTFNSAIRAFMRQDPDVILVGEIRDSETAQLALRASITGHLVLSTLHTNDAVGAISRLSDLGVANYLIGSATIAVIAQRLVRKLCKHCKKEVSDIRSELQKWQVPKKIVSEFKNITIFEPRGCKKCSQSGYSSREVIMEILLIDKTIEDMIVKSRTSLEILDYASSKGMISLLDDGYAKVLEGTTSFEEISRMVLDRSFN